MSSYLLDMFKGKMLQHSECCTPYTQLVTFLAVCHVLLIWKGLTKAYFNDYFPQNPGVLVRCYTSGGLWTLLAHVVAFVFEEKPQSSVDFSVIDCSIYSVCLFVSLFYGCMMGRGGGRCAVTLKKTKKVQKKLFPFPSCDSELNPVSRVVVFPT